MVRRKPSKAFLHLREWCSKIREQQPKNETPSQSNGSDGFKFAITLIAALLTFSYATHNYLQNTFIDDLIGYAIVASLFSLAVIFASLLILYIIIKGYSMEVQNTERQKYLERMASCVYLFSFPVALVFLVGGCFAFLLYLEIGITWVVVVFPFIICIISIIILKNLFFNDVCDESALLPMIMALVVVSLVLPSILSSLPLLRTGHVTADMGDVCYKNNVPIPVLIQVTGLERELNISIYGGGPDHPFVLVDCMELKHYDIFYRNFSKEGYMVGNALGRGKFTVFINTTNLTTGYYVLTCKHWDDGDPCSKGFYLLNNSQQLYVE